MRRALAWTIVVVTVGVFVIPFLVLPPIFGLAIPATAATSGFTIFYVDDPFARLASFSLAATFTAFSALGLVIVHRWPTHRMGWVLIAIGASFAVAFGSGAYGAYGTSGGLDLPAADLFLWSSSWSWIPGFALLITFVLIFPTGHLLSPRWRSVVWILLASTALQLASYFLGKDPSTGGLEVHRPFVIPGADDVLWVMGRTGDLVQAVAFVGAGAALIARFRRGSDVERQQVKLLAFSVTLFAIGILGISVASVLWDAPTVYAASTLPMSLGLTTLPVAAGVAILRYRLYDVDVLINRTLVYGPTVALVAAVFVTAALFFQTLLRPFTAGSDLAVAVSTLATVAAFQPLRRYVQRVIDRVFYRSRYDAARTLDEFTTRLRDEVDLETVRGDLLSAIDDTVRPKHANVWLR